MASIARADELVEHTTKAALEEKAKLQKHFGRFDIFFFLICTLVGLDTLGAVSNDGAQAFTWLVFLGRLLLRPVRAAGGRARLVVHRGGRRLHLGQARVRALHRRDQRGPLLALEPDLARRHADDPRRHHVRRLLHAADRHLEVPVLARLHLVRGVGGDPVLRRRQVDPDDRRLGADRACSAASPSRSILYALDHGVHGVSARRLQADVGDLHRRRPGAVLQLRRLRAAQRRRGRDEGPAEGRAVHRPPRGDRDVRALRRADPGDPARAAGRADHQPRRLHRRHEDRLHGLRRARRPPPPTARSPRRSPAPARCSATSPRSASSGRCCRAAPRGSWAPTARRPSPASTAPRRAGSASSPSAGARRSSSTSCPASSRRSSCSWPSRSPAARGQVLHASCSAWRSRPRRSPTCSSSRR